MDIGYMFFCLAHLLADCATDMGASRASENTVSQTVFSQRFSKNFGRRSCKMLQ